MKLREVSAVQLVSTQATWLVCRALAARVRQALRLLLVPARSPRSAAGYQPAGVNTLSMEYQSDDGRRHTTVGP
jgi:hypothetical protein